MHGKIRQRRPKLSKSHVEEKSRLLITWTSREERQKTNELRMDVKTSAKKDSKLKPRMKQEVRDKSKALKGR